MDIKQIIGSVAPTLATALGGPLAGAAVKAVGEALGVTQTEEAVTTALKEVTPEQLSALKQADNDFKLKMRELDVNLESLRYAGVNDARNREVQTSDHLTPRLLALFAIICFIGLVYGVSSGITVVDGMKDTFLILVGAAITVFKDVYGYYFGSSSGSKEKDILLAGKV